MIRLAASRIRPLVCDGQPLSSAPSSPPSRTRSARLAASLSASSASAPLAPRAPPSRRAFRYAVLRKSASVKNASLPLAAARLGLFNIRFSAGLRAAHCVRLRSATAKTLLRYAASSRLGSIGLRGACSFCANVRRLPNGRNRCAAAMQLNCSTARRHTTRQCRCARVR